MPPFKMTPVPSLQSVNWNSNLSLTEGFSGSEKLIVTSTVPEIVHGSRPAFIELSCDGAAFFIAAESTGSRTGGTASPAAVAAKGMSGVNIDEKMPCPTATSATVPAIAGAFCAVIAAGSLAGMSPVNPPSPSLLPPHAASKVRPAVATKIFLSACFIAISRTN